MKKESYFLDEYLLSYGGYTQDAITSSYVSLISQQQLVQKICFLLYYMPIFLEELYKCNFIEISLVEGKL